MSMINRPFRGFSGTFTRPDLPLSHPEIPLDAPVHVVAVQKAELAPSAPAPSASPRPTQRSRKSSHTPPTQDAASRPQHARKPSSRLLRSISGIFASKNADTPSSMSSSFRRKSKTCEAAAECKNSSNVVIYHGNHTFTEKEKAALIDETEKLYMSCYTKAERRHFFREAKKREGEEHDMERRGSSAVLDDSEDEEHLHRPCPVHTTFELSAGAPSEEAKEVVFTVPQYGFVMGKGQPLGVKQGDGGKQGKPEEREEKEEEVHLSPEVNDEKTPSIRFEPQGIVKAATWASDSTGGAVSAVFSVSGYASSVSSVGGEEIVGRK